jgi:OOP family OmpA-OmpF porin
MENQITRWAIFSCITLLACGAAEAADFAKGFYFGGNVGPSMTSVNTAGIDASVRATGLVTNSTTTADETETGYKLYGGYRFHPNFAVEAGYFNLGTFGFTTLTTGPAATLSGRAKSDNGFNVDLVGFISVSEELSWFARIGVQTSKTSVSLVGIGPAGTASISTSETATNFKFGSGFEYFFSKNIGVRAEYERYRVPGGISDGNKVELDLLSAGVVVRF